MKQNPAEEPMETLVDLKQVATEEKCEQYASIETFSLEKQYDYIFEIMTQTIQCVRNNKESILNAVEQAATKLQGIPVEKRHIYIAGAGTSGRLAALTAMEGAKAKLFSIHFDMAGGPAAFHTATEGAEDNINLAVTDALNQNIDQHAVVVGVSASGRTPYTVAYLEVAKSKGALTLAVDNSPNSPLSQVADFTISHSTGPEFPRGSTRMKAGTSQYITLQILTRLLSQKLCGKSSLEAFDHYEHELDCALQSIQKTREELINGARLLHAHFSDPKNASGRMIYVGEGTRGLLGVIDGAELGPTYSWSRVTYVTPALSRILGREVQPPTLSLHDFVISLDDRTDLPSSSIHLGPYSEVAISIILKTLTTLFAVQNGWVLKGEMINLYPKNPNKKLQARRVQILKNLKIAKTDERALEILKNTGNSVAQAIKFSQSF